MFETIWKTIGEKYYDPAFNGVDWEAVGERYRPRLQAVRTDEEFYKLVKEMVRNLHDSHTLSRNSAIADIIHNIGVAARVVLGGMPIEEGSLHRPKPLDAQSSTQGRTREAHVLTSGSQDS